MHLKKKKLNIKYMYKKEAISNFFHILPLALSFVVLNDLATVVCDIFMRLKFCDFEENLTSIKICDFYFRYHMLHEAMPINAQGV